jgi:hypothetical protein
MRVTARYRRSHRRVGQPNDHEAQGQTSQQQPQHSCRHRERTPASKQEGQGAQGPAADAERRFFSGKAQAHPGCEPPYEILVRRTSSGPKNQGNEPQREKDENPWFWKCQEFVGDRENDVQRENVTKMKARAAKKGASS